MMKSLLLIINPKAGKHRSRSLFYDIIFTFSEAGYLVNLQQTKGPGDACRLAREEGAKYDLVVCYGGDGTLNHVVNGLLTLKERPPIGYIAGGSTNDFAASLQLPHKPALAAKAIVESVGRQLDVGQFNDRHFVYVASFGAFARASYSAPQEVKNEIGHLAYIIEGLKDLSSLRYYKARVEADGEVFEGKFLFGAVTNATSLGGVVKLKKDAVFMDDGRFELILVPEPKNLQSLKDMAGTLVSRELGDKGTGLIMRHVSHISVETEEELSWSLDGEASPAVRRAEIHNLPREIMFKL